MPSKEPMPGRCGAKSADGYCTQWPIKGTKRCRTHPGKPLAKARAEGAVVVELERWGLGDTTVDPGEVLLRLVSQSAARVEFYGGLLRKAYEAAERLQAAEQAPQSDLLAAETAQADLERVFNHGGVAALIGNTYAADKNGGTFATGEAIRGLAQLESTERDRCANFAAKAVAAGLAERQVRLAEKHGAMLAAVLAEVVRGLGSDPADPAVAAVVQAAIGRHAGVDTRVIEGSAA